MEMYMQVACGKQHNMRWLYKIYLEQKKKADIVQSKLQDTKYSMWDEVLEREKKKMKWMWVENGQLHDSIKSIQKLLDVSGICTYYGQQCIIYKIIRNDCKGQRWFPSDSAPMTTNSRNKISFASFPLTRPRPLPP